MFDTEKEMSKVFERYLKRNFGNAYLKECKGLFGIPDFVSYSKQEVPFLVYSFELKLADWKRATIQAFRYKSFSNVCYVVMPIDGISAAKSNLKVFEKYNIGLAQLDKRGAFEAIFKPTLDEPYSDYLSQKFLDSIGKSRRKSKNLEILVRRA